MFHLDWPPENARYHSINLFVVILHLPHFGNQIVGVGSHGILEVFWVKSIVLMHCVSIKWELRSWSSFQDSTVLGDTLNDLAVVVIGVKGEDLINQLSTLSMVVLVDVTLLWVDK